MVFKKVTLMLGLFFGIALNGAQSSSTETLIHEAILLDNKIALMKQLKHIVQMNAQLNSKEKNQVAKDFELQDFSQSRTTPTIYKFTTTDEIIKKVTEEINEEQNNGSLLCEEKQSLKSFLTKFENKIDQTFMAKVKRTWMEQAIIKSNKVKLLQELKNTPDTGLENFKKRHPRLFPTDQSSSSASSSSSSSSDSSPFDQQIKDLDTTYQSKLTALKEALGQEITTLTSRAHACLDWETINVPVLNKSLKKVIAKLNSTYNNAHEFTALVTINEHINYNLKPTIAAAETKRDIIEKDATRFVSKMIQDSIQIAYNKANANSSSSDSNSHASQIDITQTASSTFTSDNSTTQQQDPQEDLSESLHNLFNEHINHNLKPTIAAAETKRDIIEKDATRFVSKMIQDSIQIAYNKANANSSSSDSNSHASQIDITQTASSTFTSDNSTTQQQDPQFEDLSESLHNLFKDDSGNTSTNTSSSSSSSSTSNSHTLKKSFIPPTAPNSSTPPASPTVTDILPQQTTSSTFRSDNSTPQELDHLSESLHNLFNEHINHNLKPAIAAAETKQNAIKKDATRFVTEMIQDLIETAYNQANDSSSSSDSNSHASQIDITQTASSTFTSDNSTTQQQDPQFEDLSESLHNHFNSGNTSTEPAPTNAPTKSLFTFSNIGITSLFATSIAKNKTNLFEQFFGYMKAEPKINNALEYVQPTLNIPSVFLQEHPMPAPLDNFLNHFSGYTGTTYALAGIGFLTAGYGLECLKDSVKKERKGISSLLSGGAAALKVGTVGSLVTSLIQDNDTRKIVLGTTAVSALGSGVYHGYTAWNQTGNQLASKS